MVYHLLLFTNCIFIRNLINLSSDGLMIIPLHLQLLLLRWLLIVLLNALDWVVLLILLLLNWLWLLLNLWVSSSNDLLLKVVVGF